MKDKFLHVKVSEEYKKRIKAAADYSNSNMSRFIIDLINKELKRLGK